MKDKITELKARFDSELALATSAEKLEALRVNFLGKKGAVAELMKGLRDVEDKKSAGQLINSFKGGVESAGRGGTSQGGDRRASQGSEEIQPHAFLCA